MKLIFIRHGQTDWNLAGKIQGHNDIELNETGIMQAKQVSNTLASENLDIIKVYSSQQKRAFLTASIVSQKLEVDCISIKGLEEINLGLWECLSWEEVKQKYPIEFDEWFTKRRHSKVHKGESYQELLERLLPTLIHIIKKENEEQKKEQEKNVVIVTHSAVIETLQCFLEATPFEKMGKYKVDNASVVIIDSQTILNAECMLL